MPLDLHLFYVYVSCVILHSFIKKCFYVILLYDIYSHWLSKYIMVLYKYMVCADDPIVQKNIG